MLGIHRVTSARAHYYLSDLAGELPLPAAAGERPAVWIGRAAEGLGLGGEVDRGRLRAVLEGRHPVSGHRLRSARATVLGFDMTFSAPKSVSVLFGLGGDDVAQDVVAAHGAGVRGAVAYLETHGLAARRGSGDRARHGSHDRSRGRVVHPRGQPQPGPSSPHPCRDVQHGPRDRRPVERVRPSWHLGAQERCLRRLRGPSAQ